MAFFFFPPHAHKAEMGSGLKPLQSSKALNVIRALLSPSPFHKRAVGKQEAQLQDKEQKSQGNVTSVVISTHAKVPSAFFFFFPFEISNSSLWTKSCLSENIDLRPLTKLHFKQSRGLLFPLPTDVSAQSLDLPGSCQKFCTGAQHWYLHKADFALNVSSFLSGKNLGNNQVGALSPAIHLASHCR